MRLTLASLFPMLLVNLLVAAPTVDYVDDVLPILEKHCIACHSQDEAEGDFVLESHAAMMQGGEGGVAITAGVPGSSRMFLMAAGKLEPVMPPDGEKGMNEEELALISAWIEQGAIGPDGNLPIKRNLRTPEIPSDQSVELPITAIAISPDGQSRAVAHFNKIQILNQNDAVIATLQGEVGKVNSLRFSRDGSKVLVASGLTGAYGVAAIYLAASGELLTEMVGHRDTLYAAEFSPDEKLVATAGYDRDIVLWIASSGEPIKKMTGHNGAIFDLAFSPDGQVLVSACADETLKVWNVESGERLDTLGQPEGEVFAVEVTGDGKHIIAGSSDNRLRVWNLVSKTKPAINPLVVSRFVDESPIVHFAMTPDSLIAIVLSEAGNLKTVSTSDWSLGPAIESINGVGSDLSIMPDGKTLLISLMNGDLVSRSIPVLDQGSFTNDVELKTTYLDLGPLTKITEAESKTDSATAIPRGAIVTGKISQPGEEDTFAWNANRGEVWAIDADPYEGSRIDPVVAIFDNNGEPVLRTRLQAVRDTYFTFRGKNSTQVDDFRLFAYQELNLNDFLYASGEVTRLWLHPRGPDSGFNVYPNDGNRWTYFGTSHTTHALGEPAYVVRPLQMGEPPVANGLPVFDIYYENDDDPNRLAGSSSRLLFTAPADGIYHVRMTDTRGEGGEGYGYELKVRAAEPSFKPSVTKINKPLLRGSGREIQLRVDRQDGFQGPVTFHLDALPEGLVSNFPVTIEPGQRMALATIWAPAGMTRWEGDIEPRCTATAPILGRSVERQAGSLGKIELGERPNAIPIIEPNDSNMIQVSGTNDWKLQVRRGETVSAKLVLDRKDDFLKEVSLGKETAGRNTAFGVIVDNIGLNGLLLLEGETTRTFFLTADENSPIGKRSFFLTANIDGGVTTHPITLEVLP